MVASKKKIQALNVGNFRFKKMDKDYLITNDSGDWQWLSQADFKRFAAGKIGKGDKIYRELSDKGFLDVDKKRWPRWPADIWK